MLRSRRPTVLALLVVTVLSSRAEGAGDQVSWTVATIAPDGSPVATLLDDYMRAIERVSGGKLRIRVLHGGVVADEAESFELCKQGRTQIWVGSMGAAVATIPALGVFDLPYLFDDLPAFDRARARRPDVLEKGLIGKTFRERGLVPWGYAYVGWRAMSMRERQVRIPSDLRGLKMRSQPAPLHRAMWKLLGVQALDTQLTEMLSTFRLKQVDGTDTPALFVFATSIAEHIRFHTRTNHILQSALLVFNREALEKLPKKTQQGIMALRTSFYPKMSRMIDKQETDLVEQLIKERVKVSEPTPEERTAWKEAFAPLRSEAVRLGGPAGAELLKSLEAARK